MIEQVPYVHRSRGRYPDYVVLVAFEYTQEEGKWVGVCRELGTSTFADTLSELQSELRDAVALQLNEVERLGFVPDYLRDNHVTYIPIGPAAAPSNRGFVVAGNSG